MKKKYRDISVKNVPFAWQVGKYNCDGDYNMLLTIWKDGKQIYSRVVKGGATITPKFVSKFIGLYLS
jgi:hypothetical protein